MGNKFLKPRSNEPTFTKSTGLYPRCEWDDKTVKKLINKKKIAPRYPGREDQAPDLDECPICFLVRKCLHHALSSLFHMPSSINSFFTPAEAAEGQRGGSEGACQTLHDTPASRTGNTS
jgi:hypothetical protein